MNNGWIKIERAVTDHWIFKDPWKFRNWIDLLVLVNHAEQKVEIGGKIFVCKKGETLRSLLSLSNRWQCSRSKARRFLKLLEKDKMIVLKDERKTTRITICNYASYQTERNTNETQTKRTRTQTRMNKNDKKNDFKNGMLPFKDQYGKELLNEFFLYWTEPDAKGKMRYEKQSAFAFGRRLSTWSKNQSKYDTGSDGDLSNYLKNKTNKK